MLPLQKVGLTLSQTRKQNNLTQQQVSQATGIHKSTLSEIENGRFSGSLDIFMRYIEYLGFELDITQRQHQLPDWDELDSLFEE
ncbi:MAG: helix-turn-helix domain-containing protein [Pseudomonadota bacterium]